MVESTFGQIKRELVHHETYATRDGAKASIFEYVEVFYNRVRRHSTLGYVFPLRVRADAQPEPPLLTCTQSVGRITLRMASGRGHLEVVKLLIERGAALNPRGQSTPLDSARNSGVAEVFDYLRSVGGKTRAELAAGQP